VRHIAYQVPLVWKYEMEGLKKKDSRWNVSI